MTPLETDTTKWIEAEAADLMPRAAHVRDSGHGSLVSYSRKVFIPLTRACRQVCGYCTFVRAPRRGSRVYLTPEEVLAIALAGQRAGCHEALFTLGDKPELRWPQARRELRALGYERTVDYLAAMCEHVQRETGLLPHTNPGVLERPDIERLRLVSASQGLMLETVAERLCAPGGPHFGAPDKAPSVRLAMLEAAGEARVPFTTGILIGIGETRAERIESLLAIRSAHRRHGHIQEVIVQNFRAKPRTGMRSAPDASLEELLWTIAVARLILGPSMNLQAPPNLSPDNLGRLLDAGINDWGGVSPVTPDHVNPEAPWPLVEILRRETASRGKTLVERLASYPAYCLDASRWHVPAIAHAITRGMDADGYARTDPWSPGLSVSPPPPLPRSASPCVSEAVRAIVTRARAGEALAESDIVRLFGCRSDEFDYVCEQADQARREAVGDTVHFVVNRNINYTNICTYHCSFCAFSKGRHKRAVGDAPYRLDYAEIARRVAEAWQRGATEVCLQGGIHPDYSGETYLEIVRTVKAAAPAIHVHAFTPLEVSHGAATLGLDTETYLRRLIAAGLGSLPGTAAEILDDEVRSRICPDKLDTAQWLEVMRTAHALGLRSTATIMFGHVDAPVHWAHHLLRIRALQAETRGFTEFIPLPFVHMDAPVYRRGEARKGPTFREAVLMHAVARLALLGMIDHIQVSWVKMGRAGVDACLAAGADDLGGTLMNESISRAAGTQHGQELPPAAMEVWIREAGRTPRQRSTLYQAPGAEQVERARNAAPLAPVSLCTANGARALTTTGLE